VTSEFIYVHLGLDGVQSEHKDVYWFKHEWPYVYWVSLQFMLPCTGVLVVGGYKLFERGSGSQVSCEWWCVKRGSVYYCCDFFLCFDLSLDVAPASPFIASKGRGQVTIMVKR
jgi:hypothetical protein